MRAEAGIQRLVQSYCICLSSVIKVESLLAKSENTWALGLCYCTLPFLSCSFLPTCLIPQMMAGTGHHLCSTFSFLAADAHREIIHSFITKCLLVIYYIPSNILNARGNTKQNWQHSCFMELGFQKTSCSLSLHRCSVLWFPNQFSVAVETFQWFPADTCCTFYVLSSKSHSNSMIGHF